MGSGIRVLIQANPVSMKHLKPGAQFIDALGTDEERIGACVVRCVDEIGGSPGGERDHRKPLEERLRPDPPEKVQSRFDRFGQVHQHERGERIAQPIGGRILSFEEFSGGVGIGELQQRIEGAGPFEAVDNLAGFIGGDQQDG